MESKVKRREWVKTAAIIFLAVLLVLTFFSNTIMNYSLPEVAVQMVNSGTINAKIRGSGTVGANETYDVTIKQTRRVGSVLVRVGQEVRAGDPLFLLEAEESEELKAAQMELDSMELSYQKSLIEAGNSSATENREVQKAQQDYNDALRVYNQYSSLPAESLAAAKAEAEQRLKNMNREKDQLTADKTKIEKEKADNSAGLEDLETAVSNAEKLKTALDAQKRDQYLYQDTYNYLLKFSERLSDSVNGVQSKEQIAAALAKDQARFEADVGTYYVAGDENAIELSKLGYNNVATAHDTLVADQAAIDALDVTPEQIANADAAYSAAIRDLEAAKASLSHYDVLIEQYETSLTNLDYAISDQTSAIADLASAASAAETVKATKEALEDLIFRQNLGDSGSLDIQAAKDAIEKKKEDIEKLTLNADEVEVTAKVSGRIGEINVTAGSQVGAEEVMARIQMVDRGYTLKIPVTNEQAKKVKVGDKAELVNYWGGDVEAILESIANDPQNQGKGRLLVFRLNGEVEADTNLTLSIGQKSANFDCLVPKSAVRTDSNGSFVLVMTAKSSPLGNRYTATRAEVEVLASDDKMSAVTGLSYGDFVITTSSKPIEAGQQVRQVDES